MSKKNVPIGGKNLTEAQKDKYVHRQGNMCPFCESWNIKMEQPEIMDNGIEADVSCDDCKRTWTDIYRLVAVETETEE